MLHSNCPSVCNSNKRDHGQVKVCFKLFEYPDFVCKLDKKSLQRDR